MKWMLIICLLLLLVVFVGPTGVFAEDKTADQDAENHEKVSEEQEDELLNMSLEELINIEVAVSASRKEQPVKWSAMPVEIVTSEQIHESGLTTIAEVLQYVPEVDLLWLDRNRLAIGLRGLHDTMADHALTLIDGRHAGNTITDAPDLGRYPILIEDIERIEVVRGPGGAAWGANAMNGVINIITKDPENTLGWLASTTWTHLGDSYNHLRWGAKSGALSWRISLGYECFESSDDAVDDDNFSSDDFGRNFRFDSKAVYKISDQTKISAGAGFSQHEAGAIDAVGLVSQRDDVMKMTRLFTRIDHTIDDDTSAYLQWFGNIDYTVQPTLWNYRAVDNDLEGQLQFKPCPDHQFILGGNIRQMHLNSSRTDPQPMTFVGEPFDEWLAGAYFIDRWQTTERLVIESQVRGDYGTAVDPDWSGRLAALYALDEKQHHVIRASTARAFRTPSLELRESYIAAMPMPSPPFPPGTYAYQLFGDDDLKNEDSWTLELGYDATLTDWLHFQVDGYYQRYNHLSGTSQLTSSIPFILQVRDKASGDAWGGTMELKVQKSCFRVSGWYAYNEFEADYSGAKYTSDFQSIRTYFPAKHKVGLTGSLFLPDDWTFNVNSRFSDITPEGMLESSATSSHRVDFTLSKKIAKLHGEFMVGILDLFNRTTESVPGYIEAIPHDLPGRKFFARLQFAY